MASFEDLSFDWESLCQECPECWTASVVAIFFIIQGQQVQCMPATVETFKMLVTESDVNVCGSDFKTYHSEEELIIAQKKYKDLNIAYNGPCGKDCQIYAPVCGSDLKDYKNICDFLRAKFKNNLLTVLHDGKCKVKDHKKKRKPLVSISYYNGISSHSAGVDDIYIA